MQEEKLAKLKELLKLADSGLTREEFTSNFTIIINLIKELKLANQREREALLIMLKSFEAKMESNQTSEMDKSKQEMMAMCEKELNKVLLAHEAMISEIDAKMARMDAIQPPDTSLIVKQASDLAIVAIKPLIVPKDDLKIEIPKLGDLIVKTVNALPAEDSWHIEDIYKLREELDELRQLRGRTLGGGGFSHSAWTQYIVDDEVPVNSGDNLNFTINHTPSPATSLKVYLNGMRLKLGTDYTLSGKTLTLLVALLATDLLVVDYIR